MIRGPYLTSGEREASRPDEMFVSHVSTAADVILIMQRRGWKLFQVDRVDERLSDPAPWWATREWRGTHVQLHFRWQG